MISLMFLHRAAADEPVLLEDPKLKELASKYGKSPAQVALWSHLCSCFYYASTCKPAVLLFMNLFLFIGYTAMVDPKENYGYS